MYWEPKLLSYPTSLYDEEDSKYHAQLTDAGREKLKARAKGHDNEMEAGVDYVVKDGGDDWVPYPDSESTRALRHTWILARRRRPKVPSFAGAPVPRHAAGQHQRAAMIVMTYFHPWTLRHTDGDAHVPYAGELRSIEQDWQEALTQWLNGNVVCAEAKRYVSNFLAVHRVRPRDDESDCGISDDIVSDEELQVSNVSLADALITRIGGQQQKENRSSDGKDESLSHFQNSEAAITLGQSIWGSSCGNSSSSDARVAPSFVAPQSIENVFKEATASQRRETSMQSRMHGHDRVASLQTLTSATVEDVEKWLQELKVREDGEGRLVTNVAQYQAVEKVAQRVMQELRAGPGASEEDFGEPLRWLVHGGPGTGKSKHVLAIVKELFEEVLKWDMGVEFQMVALQAVMADILGGDTIHHALGISVHKSPGKRKQGLT